MNKNIKKIDSIGKKYWWAIGLGLFVAGGLGYYTKAKLLATNLKSKVGM